jgi:hypothetical protein
VTTTQQRPATADHQPRKRATSGAANRSAKKTDEALEQGLALSDHDGTRLQVRVRDVKGIHDARLMEVCGMDFMGLMEAMTQRRGMDLFGAALWFARLVNGREPETYAQILERFGFEDFIQMDMDQPKAADDAPKASAASS